MPQKIADYYHGYMILGTIEPGDRLPGRREIARIWSVAAGTAYRALAELERRGLAVTRRGDGSFASKFNATALGRLEAAGITPAQWAQLHGAIGGTWFGDECGCPDNRCANGFHHYGADDCGCLPALLEDLLNALDGDGAESFYSWPAHVLAELRGGR